MINEIEPIIVEEQTPEKRELQFAGKLLPHKGHKLWAVHLETLEVEEVEYEDTYDLGNPHKKKAIKEDGWYYTCALNKKNALKNFHNGKSGSR